MIPSIDQSDIQQLVSAACDARLRAHAPYSRFQVGAVVLAEDGTLYFGCNVENASYGATICAERVAACSAIADGATSWVALAVASPGGAPPCGICRQFLAEFAPRLPILIIDSHSGDNRLVSLADLLPDSFGAPDLR